MYSPSFAWKRIRNQIIRRNNCFFAYLSLFSRKASLSVNWFRFRCGFLVLKAILWILWIFYKVRIKQCRLLGLPYFNGSYPIPPRALCVVRFLLDQPQTFSLQRIKRPFMMRHINNSYSKINKVWNRCQQSTVASFL